MAKLYDYINEHTKIKDVISYYGLSIDRNNNVLCPFHDDLNPSMKISEKKNIAKCFSCGAGGKPIKFILQYEREVNHNPITFNQAAKIAADIGDYEMQFEFLDNINDTYKYTANGKLYDVQQQALLKNNALFKDLFLNELKSEQGSIARTYLDSRGIDEKSINSLEIGYVTPGLIENYIKRNKNIDPSLLEEVGLIQYDTTGNLVERFKNRIMIPLKDEKGNVVAFTGRSSDGAEPKYLHTHDSLVFKKSNILYNYHLAKEYAYDDEMYIVEGNLDVAGGNQIGLHNIVATMGVSISDEQISLLQRCNCDITLMRDNDRAGREAILNEIPLLLKNFENRSIQVVDTSKLAMLEKVPTDAPTKDLLDFANAKLTIPDIENAKESAFSFYIKHQYFRDKERSPETIFKVYHEAKKDGIIVNTLDEQNYLDVVSHLEPSYPREMLESIIHPKVLPSENIVALDVHVQNYIAHKVQIDFTSWIEKNNEPFSKYQAKHVMKINTHIANFVKDNLNDLFKSDGDIDYEVLQSYILEKEKDYEEFSKIHNFAFQEVFTNTYLKTRDMQAAVSLNEEQQLKVIRQFDQSLSVQEKERLGCIDELYIINDLSDITQVLPELVNPVLLESIEDTMSTDTKMQYFKFASVFNKELLHYVDPIYLNHTKDNYKTILLFNNLDKHLELKNENIKSMEKVMDSMDVEVEHEKDVSTQKDAEPEKEKTKDMDKDFTNAKTEKRILLAKEDIIKTTDQGYFFKSSDDEISLFVPKKLAYWQDENKNHLYIIPKLKSFSKTHTVITKYINHKNAGSIKLDELSSITKMVKTTTKENADKVYVNLHGITLQKEKEYIHIPALVHDVHGYFKVNQAYFNQEQESMSGKANFEYSFYDQKNLYVSKYSIAELQVFIDDEKHHENTVEYQKDFEKEGF